MHKTNTPEPTGPQRQPDQSQPNAPLMTEVACGPLFQRSPVPLSPRDVLRLNSVVGNRAVQRIMTSRTLQRKPTPLPQGVLNVRDAIKRSDYVSQPTSQDAQGSWGAFYYLNQMESEELITTLGKLTVAERAMLLENLSQGETTFDTQRINTALRSVAIQDPTTGQASVTLDNAIDDARAIEDAQKITDAIKKAEEAGSGWWGWIDDNIIDVQAPYADVYKLMAGFEDALLQAALTHLIDADLVRLINHLGDAPVEHRARWGALLASLYGKSPDLPIPKDPFRSLFDTLVGLSRVDLYKRLRLLSRENRQALLDHVEQAPEASRQIISEVLADLQGEGTNMESDDVIDLKGLSGTQRTMAQIYNNYGQFLEEQARTLNITTAAAAGIMKVESGGKTFDSATDRPVIRFENHKFWDEWAKGNKDNTKLFNEHFKFNQEGGRHTGHMWRPDTETEWVAQHVSANDQAGEWAAVNMAATLADQETAYKSMSIGAGQVMGFNHELVGYASAVEMYAAFASGERAQLGSIFEYIESTEGLVEAIRAGDYATLAKLYNGAGTVAKQQEYQTTISTAAAAYEQVTDGKKHVFPPKEAPQE